MDTEMCLPLGSSKITGCQRTLAPVERLDQRLRWTRFGIRRRVRYSRRRDRPHIATFA